MGGARAFSSFAVGVIKCQDNDDDGEVCVLVFDACCLESIILQKCIKDHNYLHRARK